MILIATFLLVLSLSLGGLLVCTRSNAEQTLMVTRFRALRSVGVVADEKPADLLGETAEANWVSRLLTRSQAARKAQRRLALLLLQSQSEITMTKLLKQCAVVGTLGALISVAFLPLLCAPVIALAMGSCPLLLLHLNRRRRIAAFNATLPDVVDMMSRSLRAGHALVAALSIVAEQAAEPARAEFAAVFRKQSFGLPLRQALYELLDRVPSQDLRVLVTGILVQKDTGGNLAEILDRIVTVIRERLKIQGEIRTHTAQGRLTGWILCLLPVAMMVIINLINPGYSKPLTDNELGRKLLMAGTFLLCSGAWFIRRIIQSIEV